MNKRRIERCIVFIWLIGLVLFAAWKLSLLGPSKKQIEENIKIWTENAKENLKENLVFIEGKNYLFVEGTLRGECSEVDPDSHCPISVSEAKINGDSLFVDDFRFAIPQPDIFPYPINEGINFFGFLPKERGSSASLEFEILDYVPNKKLCQQPHDKQGLCNIKWTKKILFDKLISAEELLVKIKDFDYVFSNQTLEISLSGDIESKHKPKISLALYSNSESMKFLIKEDSLELKEKDGEEIYIFESNKVFEIHHPEQNYSILLLAREKNSFYGVEWIFENGELKNSFIYD